MATNEYKNLTEEELEWADHYFETGNFAALRKLKEKSHIQDNSESDKWHNSNTNRGEI